MRLQHNAAIHPSLILPGTNTIVNMLNISAGAGYFFTIADLYYFGNFWMPHLAMSVLCPFTTTDTVIIKAYIHIHIGGICCQYIYIDYIVPAPSTVQSEA